MIAPDPNHDVIFNNDGRNRGGVIELRIRNLNFPTFLARFRVQANEVAIRRFEIEPVFIHPDASIANRAAGIGRILIVPQLAPGAHIGGPNIVRS